MVDEKRDRVLFEKALVVEWIQYLPPKETVAVRFRPRALLGLRAFEGEGEAGFFVGGRVLLDDAALHRLIYRLIGRGEEFLRSRDILFRECGQERLRRAGERLLAADIEDAFLRRCADRFLC